MQDQAPACERRSHSSKPMRPKRASPNGTSERPLDPAAPVSGLGVAHDLTRVADRLQIAGDDFLERCSFPPARAIPSYPLELRLMRNCKSNTSQPCLSASRGSPQTSP